MHTNVDNCPKTLSGHTILSCSSGFAKYYHRKKIHKLFVRESCIRTKNENAPYLAVEFLQVTTTRKCT